MVKKKRELERTKESGCTRVYYTPFPYLLLPHVTLYERVVRELLLHEN